MTDALKCGCPSHFNWYADDFNKECPLVFDVIRKSQLGIFQLEGHTAQSYIDRFNPSNLSEISDFTALARPGPLKSGMMEEYISVKNGKYHEYITDALKPILERTYGSLCYQEQILEICRDVAGMSLEQADIVRKSCGKKKLKELEKVKEAFFDGCKGNGHSEEVADKIWEWILNSAQYNFNKSLVSSQEVSVYSKTGAFQKNKPISKLKIGEYVRTRIDKKNIYIPVKDVMDHGIQKCIKIITADGNMVCGSYSHRILVDGRGLVSLQEIHKKDYVKGQRVIFKSKIGPHRTFDIEVDSPDHTYCLANGIITSNSHSIAYSHIAYYTAWCKAHYPLEFFTTLLRLSHVGNEEQTETIFSIVNDAKLYNIEVVPPDLQRGNMDFEIVGDNKISYGLSHIKGIGAKALKDLKKCKGAASYIDFLLILLEKKPKKNVVDGLIYSGAYIGGRR
jgi:hypothetical protein